MTILFEQSGFDIAASFFSLLHYIHCTLCIYYTQRLYQLHVSHAFILHYKWGNIRTGVQSMKNDVHIHVFLRTSAYSNFTTT